MRKKRLTAGEKTCERRDDLRVNLFHRKLAVDHDERAE
jgi:hypothetical protein